MATQVMSGHVSTHEQHGATEEMVGLGHYWRFAIMIGLSFLAMYILMYAMVDSFSSVYNNVNQAYMAGLMAAPMAIIEILLMSAMYPNKKANALILIASVAALVFFYSGIRNQFAIGDRQFLRSMIPHHSGAILMCEKANLSSPEIRDLCKSIVVGQQHEIDQMKAILSGKSGR